MINSSSFLGSWKKIGWEKNLSFIRIEGERRKKETFLTLFSHGLCWTFTQEWVSCCFFLSLLIPSLSFSSFSIHPPFSYSYVFLFLSHFYLSILSSLSPSLFHFSLSFFPSLVAKRVFDPKLGHRDSICVVSRSLNFPPSLLSALLSQSSLPLDTSLLFT